MKNDPGLARIWTSGSGRQSEPEEPTEEKSIVNRNVVKYDQKNAKRNSKVPTVMSRKIAMGPTMLLTTVLASGLSIIPARAQSVPDKQEPAPSAEQSPAPAPSTPAYQNPTAPTAKSSAPSNSTHYHQKQLPSRARQYYSLVWGVDSLTVKYVESGEIIRFTYHVLDAEKAKALNDKKAEPFLVDLKAGVKLVVPSLEKVGKLRQSTPPEAGKVYWMAFSNKGRYVKPGHLVNIEIGGFRAEGLVVQ
jgi:hypothetical protein